MLRNTPPIRGNPRVSQARIWRLYQNDAREMIDEELIEDIGVTGVAPCGVKDYLKEYVEKYPLAHTTLEGGLKLRDKPHAISGANLIEGTHDPDLWRKNHPGATRKL